MVMTMERPLLGNETEAFGSDPSSDKSYHFQYKVVDLNDLVTSHNPDLTVNPRYPKELQPRIRDRAASRIQIEGMAQHLNPRVLLHDSGFIDTGPMIVGSDNVVESGNGRTLALMVASRESPENYARYKSMLETLADKYGFTKSQIGGMKHPVLVRQRLGDTDRVKFANEANVGATMGMSPYEQALQDSKRISAETVGQLEVGEEQTIDQALRAKSNDFIVNHFISQVPANERATIADEKGQVNSQGLQRLRLALFAKTYTGDAGQKLTRIFGESADPYVKQIETAMFSSLPDMAKAAGLVSSGARSKELDVAPDIAEVVDTYASIKAQGLSVQDYLKQSQMFGERLTPFQKQLLEHMDDIGRKSKLLRDFFREAAEKIIASPPPGQGSLLGDVRVSKEEVLNGIINRQRQEIGKPAIGIAPALSRSKELAQADTPRTPGPIGVGSEVGSHEPKDTRTVPTGQPTLVKGSSVQVGLSGFGPSHAQVKMLEEFGTAPGAGGQKEQLIDEESLKAREEAKPLKGQMGLEGGVVGEEKPKAHTKEPWEMTREEYQDKELESWKSINKSRLLEKYGGSWYNQTTVLNKEKTIVRDAFFVHQKEVRQALASGKTVPASVLADYPDLKPSLSKAGEYKEIWQMHFVDYSKKLWGDNWVIGNKRLENKEYHGKTVRQITQRDYERGKLEWENQVQYALRQGKAVDPQIAKLAQKREKQPWEEGYGEQEKAKYEKSIAGKKWQEIEIDGIPCLAIKPRGATNWEIIEKSTRLSLMPPSWSGGLSAKTLDGAKHIVQTEVIDKRGKDVVLDTIKKERYYQTTKPWEERQRQKGIEPKGLYPPEMQEYVTRRKAQEATKPSIAKVQESPDIEKLLAESQAFESKRSPASRLMDESQKHQVTIEPRRITSKKLKSWKKRPGSADIRGIDSPRLSR